MAGITVDKFTLINELTNPEITKITHFLLTLETLNICNCRIAVNSLRNEYIDRVLKADWER